MACIRTLAHRPAALHDQLHSRRTSPNTHERLRKLGPADREMIISPTPANRGSSEIVRS